MGRSKLEKRQRLFDRYAANLSLYRPNESQNRFGCPICLNYFTADSIAANGSEQPLVNLAHVYPEACKGRLTTLTCRACNSRLGNHDDHMALSHRLYRHVENPDETDAIDGHVEADGERVRAKFVCKPDGPQVNVPFSKYEPHNRSMSKIVESIKSGSRPKITPTIPDKNSFRLVSLHAAYLLMFWWYGYEYLLTTDTDWVRALLCTEGKVIPDFILPSLECPLEESKELLFSAGVAKFKGHKVAFAVIPSPATDIHARFVFLPGWGEEGSTAYAAVRDSLVEGYTSGVDFEDARFLPDERLKYEAGRGYFRWCWDHFGTPHEERP